MMATKRGLAAALGAKTPRQWLLLVLVAMAAWLLSGVVFVLDLAGKAQAGIIIGWGWAALGLGFVTWLATTSALLGLVGSRVPGSRRQGATWR